MRQPLHPPELIVYDGLEPCPYLAGRYARMPMRMPVRPLSRREFDERLAAGDRRQGTMLYTADCPRCRACQPLRVEVARFRPNRSQRRTWQRGQDLFQIELGPALVDQERIDLYNRHKQGRGLQMGDAAVTAGGYASFLVDSCCDTFEIRYRVDGELVAVAVTDRGQQSLSAVYCYFDPAFSRHAPGVFSVLTQFNLARMWGMQHVYLGFYIAQCDRMNYKGRYLPHERLINGLWRHTEDGARFEEPA